MPCARVLVVEDDADINQIVTTRLTKAGYTCTQAFSGSEAKLLLGAGDPLPFDLVICDLMLPGLPGEELVTLIREHDRRLPVIVTSARTATSDKIDLLTLGADDYLTKPFDLDELVARIAVQLRHAEQTAGSSHSAGATTRADKLTFRAWSLDPVARTFTANGQVIPLTRIEFNILEILVRQPRRVFSKQELFEQAWGEPYAADDNTVNVHVSNIRAKLRPTGTDGYIKTVWGMGFKLVEA